MAVERVIRYGRGTLENTETDRIRAESCLCLSCASMDRCLVAKDYMTSV